MSKNDINENLISESRTFKGCLSSRGKGTNENHIEKIMFRLTLPEIGPIFSSTLASQELKLNFSL